MPVSPLLRPNAEADRRKRLDELLGGRDPAALGLPSLLEDAELVGSLALAGIDVSWGLVRSRGELPSQAATLRRAQRLLAPSEALGGAELLSLALAMGGLRRDPRSRDDGPPGAPPHRIEERLLLLGEWLGAESIRELPPSAAGALALARIVEIAPLVEGNGRLSRLVASHLFSLRGAPRPILVAGDAPRLARAVTAALGMQTASLAALLDEASRRSLELMIQAFERGVVGLSDPGDDPTGSNRA